MTIVIPPFFSRRPLAGMSTTFPNWSNTTPFTYQDGMTNAKLLESIINYVDKELVPYVDTEITALAEAWVTSITEALTQVDDLAGELERSVLAILTAQNASVTEKLNAITTAITQHNTTITQQLNAQNTAITQQISQQNTTVTQRLTAHDTTVTNRLAAHDATVTNRLAANLAAVHDAIDGIEPGEGGGGEPFTDSDLAGILGTNDSESRTVLDAIIGAAIQDYINGTGLNQLPTKPTNLRVVGGDNTVTLIAWDAPTTFGSSGFKAYAILYKEVSDTVWSVDATTDTSRHIPAGDGGNYHVKVAAQNIDGMFGPYSDTFTIDMT